MQRKRFIPSDKRGKLGNTTKPGIMLGYSTRSTEYIVLDFGTAEIVLAPSTSTFRKNEFPGIPDEVL